MHHRDRTRLNHVKAQHLLVEAPALRKVNNAKCAMADAPHLQQGLLRRSLGDHSHLRSPQSCRINRPRKPMTQFSHAFSIGLTSVPICSISTVTSSPGRSHLGGLKPAPTPCGVPVVRMSPGQSSMTRDMKGMSQATSQCMWPDRKLGGGGKRVCERG